MSLTFAELKTFITTENAEELILDYLQTLGFTATDWQSDEALVTMLKSFADLDSKRSAAQAFFALNRFNSTATDAEIMKEISRSDFDNEPNPAVAAQYLLRFSLVAAATPVVLTAGDVVVSTTDGLKTYRLTQTGTVPAGGSVYLTVDAEIAGSASNVSIGEISNMVTTYAGVTCTNPSAATRRGTDEESIEAMRLRNRQKWASLSIENVKSGVEYLIKANVAGITSVAVDDTNPHGAGTVDIYCAGDLGPAGAADLASAEAVIYARFFNPDPRIQLLPAWETLCPIEGVVLFNSTVGQPAVQAGVEAALARILSDTPIGGRTYQSGSQYTHVLLRDDVIDVLKDIPGVDAVSLSGTGNYQIPNFYKMVPPPVWNFLYQATSVT